MAGKSTGLQSILQDTDSFLLQSGRHTRTNNQPLVLTLLEWKVWILVTDALEQLKQGGSTVHKLEHTII
jgi:hypothetical protein